MKKETLHHIFARIPELETERLLLRQMRVRDAQDMFAYASDPEVTQYLLWRPHPNLQYTAHYLEYLAGRYRLGQHYEWAVISKETGHMIGTCGFARIDCQHNCGEIGYVLHPAYHGQGLAVEASRRVIEFGFGELSLNRIEARYMKENTASLRVMEKLGMRFEGVERSSLLVKGLYRDIGKCAILAKEFQKE